MYFQHRPTSINEQKKFFFEFEINSSFKFEFFENGIKVEILSEIMPTFCS